jgi:hypothetical protein
MYQREGVAQGLGVGEATSSLRLLSSALSIVWTPLYGHIYSSASPSAMWLVAGGFSLLSAAVHALTPQPQPSPRRSAPPATLRARWTKSQ